MSILRRVVFVAPFGLRHKTTVWARTLPLARRLVQHGYTPTVLIPPWDSPEDAGAAWQDDGVEVINVQLNGGLPAVTARLLREIAARDPAIVHIVKPRAHAGLVQWLLWQRRRLGPAGPRLLLDIDDWEQAWAPVNNYQPALARFLAWQEEWGLRHADGITAASRWLESRAHDYTHKAPILYLPNGVSSPDASLDPPAPPAPPAPWRESAPPPAVLYFTRFVEVQPEWLADMAANLLSRSPEIRIIIAGRPLLPAGDTAFRDAFTTRNLAPSPRVLWLGSVDPATLPGLYAATRLAIFPSDDTPLQQAKCSVRLANTLLSGVPVVASAVGEQVHYGAAGSACLVPANATPQEFATAVADILSRPEARRTMVAQAREHLARHYCWDDLTANLAHFYAQISPK